MPAKTRAATPFWQLFALQDFPQATSKIHRTATSTAGDAVQKSRTFTGASPQGTLVVKSETLNKSSK